MQDWWRPGSETKTPDSETKTPDSETKTPDSETKTPDSETKNIRKLKTPGSETKTLIRKLKTQIRKLKPLIRKLKDVTLKLQPVIRDLRIKQKAKQKETAIHKRLSRISNLNGTIFWKASMQIYKTLTSRTNKHSKGGGTIQAWHGLMFP